MNHSCKCGGVVIASRGSSTAACDRCGTRASRAFWEREGVNVRNRRSLPGNPTRAKHDAILAALRRAPREWVSGREIASRANLPTPAIGTLVRTRLNGRVERKRAPDGKTTFYRLAGARP